MKLEIRDLCVSYGGIRALKGISLSVEEGQIVTLIGANGAGKSTTLRAISGLEKAQSGSITYGGEELTSLPAKEIVRRGIIHGVKDVSVEVDGVTGATLTSNGVAAMVNGGLKLYKDFLGAAVATAEVEEVVEETNEGGNANE